MSAEGANPRISLTLSRPTIHAPLPQPAPTNGSCRGSVSSALSTASMWSVLVSFAALTSTI